MIKHPFHINYDFNRFDMETRTYSLPFVMRIVPKRIRERHCSHNIVKTFSNIAVFAVKSKNNAQLPD